MAILIERDKVKELQQAMTTMENDLYEARAIKQEYESQLKQQQTQQSSQLVFTESQVKAITENDNQLKDQIEALKKEL